MEKKKELNKILNLKERARTYNVKEGIFSSAKDSLGVQYISPFAIAVNSSNSIVALLTSLPAILSPISQIIGSKQIAEKPRKKIVLKNVLLESLVWIFFILICVLFSKNILVFYLPFFVLFGLCLYEVFGGLGYPAWFSWTGDIINEKYRGRWFSKRSLILGAISLILAIISAFFLDILNNQGKMIEGFAILFASTFILRILSYRTFKKTYEPKIKLEKTDYFSFWQFIKKAPKTNFGNFAIYRGLIGFSSAISSSLVTIYLLRNLGFNYTEYMILIYAGTFFSLICMELWGKIADKYGNYFVLCITSVFIPIIPILWILHPSFIYLLIVPSLVEGISWAGFNLATGNFIYDNVRIQKRGLAVSYYNMLRGIGIFLGAGISAILIGYLKVSLIQPIIAIFILSSIIRMIVVFFFLNKIKETKSIRKTKNLDKFREIFIKQAKPTLISEFHDIISIKSYLKK